MGGAGPRAVALSATTEIGFSGPFFTRIPGKSAHARVDDTGCRRDLADADYAASGVQDRGQVIRVTNSAALVTLVREGSE